MNSTGTRYPYIDLLNILACIGVVMLHSTTAFVHGYSGNINTACVLGIFTHSFILWPVDVFFMISGATLINESTEFKRGNACQFYKKRIKRILVPLLIWNLLYGIKYWIWKDYLNHFNAVDALRQFITFDYNPTFWFFIPLLIIYISLPFISTFALNASNKELKLFLILGFFLISLVEPLFESLHLDVLYNLFPWGSKYILFAIAGYYISEYNIEAKYRKIIYSFAILSAIFLFVSGIYVSINHLDVPLLFSYTFAPCALTALGVFSLIRNVNLDRANAGFLKKWSSFSFGIYLCQAMFFTMTNKVPFPIGSHPAILFPTVYLLCLVSVSIIKKIPILNKIV